MKYWWAWLLVGFLVGTVVYFVGAQGGDDVTIHYAWDWPDTGGPVHGWIVDLEVDGEVALTDTLYPSWTLEDPPQPVPPDPRWSTPLIQQAQFRIRAAAWNYTYQDSITPGGDTIRDPVLTYLRMGPFSPWSWLLHDDGPEGPPSQPWMWIDTE